MTGGIRRSHGVKGVPQDRPQDSVAGRFDTSELEKLAVRAAALVVTLDDVRRAYPTWRCWPTVGGCVARAVLVPSWIVHAATAPGLLREIEASIGARREGRHPVPAAPHDAGQGGSCRFPADRQEALPGPGGVNVAAVRHSGGAR